MERTLIIFKPDAIAKACVGEVLSRFERAGFGVAAARVAQLDGDILRAHYAHITDLPFYPEIEAFMSSCPVLLMVLEGAGAVDRVRALLGPTDSAQAAAGTIRGDLGADKMRNICHASDSPEAAAAEIARFFPGGV